MVSQLFVHYSLFRINMEVCKHLHSFYNILQYLTKQEKKSIQKVRRIQQSCKNEVQVEPVEKKSVNALAFCAEYMSLLPLNALKEI